MKNFLSGSKKQVNNTEYPPSSCVLHLFQIYSYLSAPSSSSTLARSCSSDTVSTVSAAAGAAAAPSPRAPGPSARCRYPSRPCLPPTRSRRAASRPVSSLPPRHSRPTIGTACQQRCGHRRHATRCQQQRRHRPPRPPHQPQGKQHHHHNSGLFARLFGQK